MRRVILLVLVFLFPGSSLFAFWPLSWDLDGQKNYLGPLISYEEEAGQTHVTLRPLLSSYDSPDNYTFLFPLGKSTGEKSYFVPFYMRHAGVGEHDTALFPVFWGESGERSYGGVFPFYGRLYNRFRRDEIGFFLWPLYSYSIERRDHEDKRSLALFLFLQRVPGRVQDRTSLWAETVGG